ncbi:MAG: (Na+)-NQR maturation NqrM [Planctomycetales bacterium]
MTTYFLAALIVFALVMAAMAIGVILRGRRLRGSCGGLANLRDEHGDVQCFACGTPKEDCAGVENGQARAAAEKGKGED